MANTITLTASAKFGYGGKQFIARITGRDPKFTFQREFLGRKEGKRGETTSVEVDEPGLYEIRDIDRKGNADESYCLIYEDGGDIGKVALDKSEAMALAKRLDAGSVDWAREALPHRIAVQKQWIVSSEAKNDPEGAVALQVDIGDLKAGSTVTRGALIEERRKIVAELERELAGEPEAEPETITVNFTREQFDVMTRLGIFAQGLTDESQGIMSYDEMQMIRAAGQAFKAASLKGGSQ